MAVGVEIALITTAILYVASRALWTGLFDRAAGATPSAAEDGLAVGVGTVRTAGERQIWIEVSDVSGDTFIGRLMPEESDADLSAVRPGLIMLVAFDPAVREQLSLPDDVTAVRASELALV